MIRRKVNPCVDYPNQQIVSLLRLPNFARHPPLTGMSDTVKPSLKGTSTNLEDFIIF